MSAAQSGYDVERFVSPVDEDLICPICHGVVHEAVCLRCEHIYCKACIDLCLKKKSTCPMCDLEIDRKNSYCRPPRILVNILSRLPIRCSKECSDVFKLELIEKHEEMCGRVVSCPVESCQEKQVKLARMEEHLKSHSEVEKDSAIKDLATRMEKMKDKNCAIGSDLLEDLASFKRLLSWNQWTSKMSFMTDTNLENELQACVRTGDLERTKALIDSKSVNLDVMVSKGILQEAICARNENMAILLILNGASPIAVATGNPDLNNGIHYAAKLGLVNVLVAALSIATSEAVNFPNGLGETPLHLAARNGSIEVIKALLKRGANTVLINAQKKTAKQIASELGLIECAKFMESVGNSVCGSASKKNPVVKSGSASKVNFGLVNLAPFSAPAPAPAAISGFNFVSASKAKINPAFNFGSTSKI